MLDVTKRYTKIRDVIHLIQCTQGLDYDQKQSLMKAALHLQFYDVSPVENYVSTFIVSPYAYFPASEESQKEYIEFQRKEALSRIGQFLYDNGYIEEKERNGPFGKEFDLSLKINRPEKEDNVMFDSEEC